MRACPNGGEPVSLRQLLPDARFLGADDVWTHSCSGDSRRIKRGDLFSGHGFPAWDNYG